MHPLAAVILGIVQGITEFLPISSSAHLALLEHYFDLKGGGLGFDVLLHLGTLAALLAYFFHEWLDMARAVIWPSRYNIPERWLLLYLIVGSIPGAVAGVLWQHQAETTFRAPAHIAILLGGVGILLIVAEKVARHRRPLENLMLMDAILIGLSQALAIMPGVSRSGITMTCALFLGFYRRDAAHFSFLLSTPIIAGAGLYHLKHWKSAPPADLSVTVAALGFLAALVSSYLTIKFLLRFLQHHSFTPFAIYRLALAAVVLVLALGLGR